MVTGEGGSQVITNDYIDLLEKEMLQAAEDLEFERAASLRDKLVGMRDRVGETVDSYEMAGDKQPQGSRRGGKGFKGKGGKGKKIPRPKR